MRRIAMVTSGGDAPGMNPAIRAVVTAAAGQGIEVVGVRRGFLGLSRAEGDVLTAAAVEPLCNQGGTMLLSARFPAMKDPSRVAECADGVGRLGAEALIVVGGEGSLQGSRALAEHGVKVVHVPSTIDNDIYGTDITIGVDTCLNTILTLMDSIRDTASSMQRTIVVEVMGRLSGYLTLMGAIGVGAHAAVIPERPFPWDAFRARLAAGGHGHVLLCAEGAMPARDVAKRIGELTGTEPRVSVLGYIQRGGTPSFFDRLLGARLGEAAVEAVAGGATGKMISYRDGKCIPVPIKDIAGRRRIIQPEVFELAKRMQILFE